MMMIPRKRNDFDLFEDMFSDPFFERKESRLMKTDIKEKKDKYIIDVDLPGYEKENIDIEIENGYLKVTAKATKDVDESDEDEKYIHKERFYGECSRSFYVGNDVKEEDIKASFKNGILTLSKRRTKEIRRKKKNTNRLIKIEIAKANSLGYFLFCKKLKEI